MRDPKDILIELSATKEAIAYVDASLKPLIDQKAQLSAHESALRLELLEEMEFACIRSLRESGLTATVKRRNDLKIENQQEVEAALAELGRLPGCLKMTLDTAAVKRIAKGLPELLPGVVSVETVYIEVEAT